jgi:hypothetical protein
MTLDTTQILICVVIAIVALDAIKDIVRDLRMWRLIETLAGGPRVSGFPIPPVGPVPPVVPPIPPVVVPPVEPPPVKPPVEPQKPPVPPIIIPPVPPVPPTPVGHSKILRGKCSWFGGPNDKGVKSDEGLALVERSDFGHGNWGGIFLPTQPEGTTGLARALDPKAFYIACRWDYTETSKKYLQGIKVTVRNPANGNTEQARPVDWGPGDRSRVADLSPGLMAKLGLTTDDVVEVDIPLPGTAPAQPDTPTQPPPPVTGGTILQHNVWPTQAECPSFYGSSEATIRANLVAVHVPWLMNGKTQTIEIHRKCAESLTRIVNFIWEQCGKSQDQIHKFGYDVFDGSFNWRVIAGTNTPSVHSYGAAIDFDAAHNAQHATKTEFKPDSLITQAFETEGWIWGGRWSVGSVDAMHFQAARVR